MGKAFDLAAKLEPTPMKQPQVLEPLALLI